MSSAKAAETRNTLRARGSPSSTCKTCRRMVNTSPATRARRRDRATRLPPRNFNYHIPRVGFPSGGGVRNTYSGPKECFSQNATATLLGSSPRLTPSWNDKNPLDADSTSTGITFEGVKREGGGGGINNTHAIVVDFVTRRCYYSSTPRGGALSAEF